LHLLAEGSMCGGRTYINICFCYIAWLEQWHHRNIIIWTCKETVQQLATEHGRGCQHHEKRKKKLMFASSQHHHMDLQGNCTTTGNRARTRMPTSWKERKNWCSNHQRKIKMRVWFEFKLSMLSYKILERLEF
jgi:hypothetical protein